MTCELSNVYRDFETLNLSRCSKFICLHRDRYCLADDRLEEAVKFLDLGNGAGWELLQVYVLLLYNHL